MILVSMPLLSRINTQKYFPNSLSPFLCKALLILKFSGGGKVAQNWYGISYLSSLVVALGEKLPFKQDVPRNMGCLVTSWTQYPLP